jgi:hypothetical protein
MKSNIIRTIVILSVCSVITQAADVSTYLVGKGQEHAQTNSSSVFTPTNDRPFRFTTFVNATATDVVQSVSLKLPAPSVQVLALTNQDGNYTLEQGYTNKLALDTAFKTGAYQFTINAVNDHTNRPTLSLAADAYPATPKILNWSDLQAVEPDQPLIVIWSSFTNGTVNDFVKFELDDTNDSPVVTTPDLFQTNALDGTASAASVLANVLDYSTSYEGRVLFFKRTALATTNYPGALGAAGYYRQTKFPVVTLPLPPSAGRIQFSTKSKGVDESQGEVSLSITRAGTQGGVDVDVFTSGGTAVAGTDYETLSRTLHFEDGENTKAVSIPVIDNFLLQSNKTVNVLLANPTGGAELGVRSNLVLTIVDNEIAAAGKLQFSATNYPIAETAGNVPVIVNRVGGSIGLVTVSYTTEDITAIGLSDYGIAAGTLVFSNGVTSRTIQIPIVNDALDETNETFRVRLTETTGGAALGTNVNATVTIQDNDTGGVFSFKPVLLATNENNPGFLVSVVRTGGTAGSVTVDYETHDGTAEDGRDYTNTIGTLTFGSNVLAKTIFVPLIDNAVADGSRFFTLTLSNATGGATISITNTATLTIKDDESSVRFTNGGFIISETQTNLIVNVVRGGALNFPASVGFTTVDDSAIAGTDYFATNGVLQFPSNVTTRSFLVRVKNNTIVDETRSFDLMLTNAQNGLLLGEPNIISVTVTNEDRGGVIRFSTNSYTFSEASTNSFINILRTGGAASGVTVKLKVEDGSADAGADYSNVTQVVTFNVGETNKKVFIPIINDALVEGPETVNLSLEDAGGGGSLTNPFTATLTINSDDVGGVINFYRTNFFAYENATNMYVIVTRTGGKAGGISVHYRTHDSLAVSPDDYTETDGDLTFAASETNGLIIIPIVNDSLAEGNEGFFIDLTDVQGGATLGTVTNILLGIIDDESSISISNATVSVSESGTNIIVTLVRSGALLTTVSVDFATADGTANAGSDYGATNGTVTFPPNTPVKTIRIPIVKDALVENDETFNFAISNPLGGVQLGTVGNQIVTILNDDFAGSVSFAATNYYGTEGSNAIVRLVRTNGLAGGVSVYFQMAGGSAFPALDYGNKTGFITFAAGQTSTNIAVPLIADGVSESTETAAMFLINTGGGLAVEAPTTATLNISDRPDPNAIPLNGPVFISGKVGTTAFTSLTSVCVASSSPTTVFQLTPTWASGATPNQMTIQYYPRTLGTNSVIGATYQKGAQTYDVGGGSLSTGTSGTLTLDAIDYTAKLASGRFSLHMRETTGNVAGPFLDVTGSFRVSLTP